MASGRGSPMLELVTSRSSHDATQEANNALWELDKGLRSGKVEDQCEAIVRFPALFVKYPYPILVNSAFLKLADVFREGTNFLKICVLKVIQESSKHLDKILNVDEIVRRVYSVIHANDPVARAITLRVFGSISSIISDRKNIHFSIRSSLDSHDQVEVEAAIFATKAFCRQSKQFAEGIYHKISEMIEGLSTPIEMKLKLIPTFQYLNHDLQTANELDVLVQYTIHDPRKQVKLGALKNLKDLAKTGSHLWTEKHVEDIAKFAMDSLSEQLKVASLDVLCTLSKSADRSSCFSKHAMEMFECLSDSVDISCTSLALKVRTFVFVSRDKEGVTVSSEQFTKLENDLHLLLALCISENSITVLKRCLNCISSITGISSNLKSNLTSFLMEMLSAVSGSFFLEICNCLVRTARTSSVDLQKHRAKLLEHLSDVVPTIETSLDEEIVVALVTLLSQAGFGIEKLATVSLQKRIIEKLGDMKEHKLWVRYKIARQAARLGFHLLASNLFSSLITSVASESNYLWIKALANFEKAEHTLMEECSTQAMTLDHLIEAYNLYQEGLIDLKASVNSSHPLYFQYKFAKLRAEMLHAYSQLITCCCSLRMCPPPRIAMALSISSGQEVHQLSRLGGQFQACVKTFSTIANGFGSLYRTSFNADPLTLQIIQVLQESCNLIVYSIEILILNRKEGSVLSSELTNSRLQNENTENHRHIQALTSMNQNIVEIVEGLAMQVRDSSVCHLQTQCLCQAIATQIEMPIPYPAYFFRSLQLTSIKLAVSPSSKSIHEPVHVNLDTQLALKVEGLIEEHGKSGFFRKVHSACITIKVKASGGAKTNSSDTKPKVPTSITLQDIVQPHNEYFSSQFLVSFNTLGQHEIFIIASVTDKAGGCWDTGPQEVVYVDVLEHGAIRRTSFKP